MVSVSFTNWCARKIPNFAQFLANSCVTNVSKTGLFYVVIDHVIFLQFCRSVFFYKIQINVYRIFGENMMIEKLFFIFGIWDYTLWSLFNEKLESRIQKKNMFNFANFAILRNFGEKKIYFEKFLKQNISCNPYLEELWAQ